MCDIVPGQRPSARDVIECIASMHMPFHLRPLAVPTDVLDEMASAQEEATVSSPETPLATPWGQRWLAGKSAALP